MPDKYSFIWNYFMPRQARLDVPESGTKRGQAGLIFTCCVMIFT
jgi:hypothetical protein